MYKSNGRSLRKPQRSTHIHNCRHKELACTLERLQPELRYCFACFSWSVEEEWDKHCQTHLKSITSKRCASITYCHTLVRPAFCPFCIGDDRLDASSRWNSWTREAKLWGHLQSHLEASRWPLKCPHPLCSLQLNDEISFLYHLSDVHGLRMNPQVNKYQQQECNSEPLINWTPDTASQKRKRQDGNEQKLQPRKRNKGALKTDCSNEQRPRQSLDRKTADGILTLSSHISSESSFTDTLADNSPQDLPGLTHSEPTSPPDADESYVMGDITPTQNFQQKGMHDELEWSRDLPETKSDGSELHSPAEDALFSLYLRSRSSSCSSAKGFHDDDDNNKKNNNGSLPSQTVAPSDICLSTAEDIYLADSIDHGTVKSKMVPIKTKKPRITLRIRQPEPRPKPKKLLRLSQPKQTLAQKSSRRKPGVKDHKKRRT